MTPDPRKLALSEHQRWLGYLQPEGLVVSPLALVDSQVQLDTGSYAYVQDRFIDALKPDPITGQLVIENFAFFARDFLGWKDELLSIFSVTAEVPDGLRISTGEHGELLQPDAAYKYFKPADPAREYLLLVRQLDTGVSLDELPDGKKERGWSASPHQKFERLLRETGVPIGILCNGTSVRLIYSPKGENSGSITFPVSFMTEIAGRTVASALDLLLSHRRLITVPEGLRLPALLRKSRDYQAHVSTALSHQVLEALFELGRGFQAADEKTHGSLLAAVWERDPQEIYGGLISSLLRMVFLLYAEDRSLMPTGELYQRNYSVQGLFESLRTDQERYPDTMDDRFGGWPRMLTLFRAVHGGCRHRSMRLPARKGHLFDPDRFPFLEGRATANDALPGSLPRISDGTLYRVLDLLLYLDGERLSYRTLDVEQIGSVYETIMGFEVQKAKGRGVALKPKKSHGAPVHIDLDSLLAAKPADREKALLETADTKLPDAAAKALKSATTLEDLLAALEKRIDRRATPHPVPVGSIILQPTDERRRSGSHYTPRSFTEPIVRKTLEPILDRLGRHPKPETILELKVADIAVGSAAFLVETCRQLADELTAAWHYHKYEIAIPPDEDEVLYARRLVAQRCLYGVDRNPMAVDLAKLSLWLATMAKDHPFTFVDHAIKCGDSLVGLTNKQITSFHWDLTAGGERILGEDDSTKRTIERISEFRKKILELREDSEFAVMKKSEYLGEADEAARKIKSIGDLVIAAFFAGSKPKERQQLRDDFLARHLEIRRGTNVGENIAAEVKVLRELRGGKYPIRPFHWEIEFPEVFSRENPGFDAVVGNPPFLGGKRISTANGTQYLAWLLTVHPNSDGNADLVAHFFRRAFQAIRKNGSFGLISTNTIGQGDTRSSGLRIIRREGGTIYAAKRRQKWPGEAAVVVSVVWIFKGQVDTSLDLDGKPVSLITAYLCHRGGDDDPAIIGQNAEKSYIGCFVMGMGFTFDDADTKGVASSLSRMESLIASNPSNKDCIFPYLGGEELSSDPAQEHRRFIINFRLYPLKREHRAKTWLNATEEERKHWLREGIVPLDYPHPVAADWPDLLAIVNEKVRHERSKKAADVRAYPWWRYWRPRGELERASEGLTRIIGLSRVGQHCAFSFAPANVIFADSMVIFTLDAFAAITALQSRPHEVWARFFASSMKDDLRYTPSDCFETFPFPVKWETNAHLEEVGRTYYEYRAALMIQNNEGLTKTYNRFHDPEEQAPEIQKLRELHAAMDRTVLDAYGWKDIPTTCEFLLDYEEDDEAEAETTGKKRKKKKPYRYRWPDEIRDEVLARLLALNAERAAEEKAAAAKPAKVGRKAPVTQLPAEDLDLFQAAAKANQLAVPTKIPNGQRPDVKVDTYFEAIIPLVAALQPEGIPVATFILALEILSEQEARTSALKGRKEPALKAWKTIPAKYRDFTTAAATLLNLLKEEDGTLVRIRDTLKLNAGFELNQNNHLQHDAMLALSLAMDAAPAINQSAELQARAVAKVPNLISLFAA